MYKMFKIQNYHKNVNNNYDIIKIRNVKTRIAINRVAKYILYGR